jgi:hypothetical protein
MATTSKKPPADSQAAGPRLDELEEAIDFIDQHESLPDPPPSADDFLSGKGANFSCRGASKAGQVV